MKFRFLPVFVFTILLITASLSLTAENTKMQVRVYFSDKAELAALERMHLDITYHGKGYVDLITDSRELLEIEHLGVKTEILHEDLVAYYQSRLDPNKTMGGYKTLDEINAYLDQMIAAHSSIMSTKVNIGYTIEVRPTWAVKISDNPEIDEDEPEILFTSAIHAREVITPEVLFYFMDWLTNNYGTDPEATFLVDNREMWFILNVNPDGYFHNQVTDPNGGGLWRKNRKNNGNGTYGVDLNRNYGYQWGYDNDGSSPFGSSETYRGTAAFSEPETQNIRDFITAHNFDITVYYHSYSNLILWPWGYDTFYTPEQALFQRIGDSIATNNYYNPTPGWGLYVTNGGSDDWGYGEQTLKNKNYSFTVEVGNQSDEFWPPTSRIQQLISENLEGNKIFAKLAGNVYAIYPPGIPTVTLPDTSLSPDYTVSWTLEDPINPPVLYELKELMNSAKVTDSCNSFDNFENNNFSTNGQVYHSQLSSFYSGTGDNMYKYFQTKTPYSIRSQDMLVFWTRYNIEDGWDYAYVEVSSNGLDFTPIPGNITTNDNPNGTNRGNGITGSSGTWVQAEFDLSTFSGQSLYFRFSYATDQSLTEYGIYFDDIYPVYTFGHDTILASDISDTYYDLTGRVPGTYYYRVRAMDADGQWGVYSEPEAILVREPYICGDTDNNEDVNILDIVFMINFKFKSGPAPENPESADVNHDGNTDILDIVHLVNYKFKSGPAPACE